MHFKKQFIHSSSGILALVFLAALFGLTAVYARFLSVNNGLFEQWYLRFAIGTIAAAIIFNKNINYKKFLHLPTKEWLLLIVRVLLHSIAAIGLYTLAAQQAKIGPVAFMQAIPSLSLLSIFLMHEKVTLKKGLLVLLSFCGAIVVILDNPTDLFDFNMGEIYSLISGVIFSLVFLTRKWHSTYLNNQEITVSFLGLSFLVTYLASLVLYQRIFPPTDLWSPLFLFVLFIAGIGAVAVIFLQHYGFERVSGIVAGTILNLEQVFGVLFGYLFYQELLTSRELIGGVIIVCAAILMNISQTKK